MDNYSHKFKVRLGMFIFGGLAIFILAIFIIGRQKNLFNPVFSLNTTFYNVSGLEVGSNVRFSGINVGTVDIIKIINDSTVSVEMLIKKDVQQFIKTDCMAGIGSSGIIGDRLVIISQGSDGAPIAKNKQSILSVEPIETDDIMASLEIAAIEFSEIMEKINSGQGTVGRLIQDTAIAANIDGIISNLENSSKSLVKIDDIMASLQTTADGTADVMASLQITADGAADIMTGINNGEGNIGKLIQDTIIVANVDDIVVNLKTSGEGLNEIINAAKENFLVRGYFRRKAKKEEREKEELLNKEEERINQEEKK